MPKPFTPSADKNDNSLAYQGNYVAAYSYYETDESHHHGFEILAHIGITTDPYEPRNPSIPIVLYNKPITTSFAEIPNLSDEVTNKIVGVGSLELARTTTVPDGYHDPDVGSLEITGDDITMSMCSDSNEKFPPCEVNDINNRSSLDVTATSHDIATAVRNATVRALTESHTQTVTPEAAAQLDDLRETIAQALKNDHKFDTAEVDAIEAKAANICPTAKPSIVYK